MLFSGSVDMFLNAPSFLIVMLGSLFVVLMKFTLAQFVGTMKVMVKAFSCKLTAPTALIEEVVGLADEARKGGLLSLEGKKLLINFLVRACRCWSTATMLTSLKNCSGRT